MNIFYRLLRKANIVFRRLFYKVFSRNIVIGRNLNFRRRFEINVVDDGYVHIGDNAFFNNDCTINVHQRVEIGSDCIFGENVKIYDHNHRFSKMDISISEQGFTCRPVHIGNNCWFGSGVIILAGTSIGDHVVVGAGCVICGDIKSNTVVSLKQEKSYERISS